MTDTFEVAVETPAIAEIVPPVEAPVDPLDEEKQAEAPDVPEFTRKQQEKAIQEAKAKVKRHYEREYQHKLLEADNQALRQQLQPKVETQGRPERQAYAGDDERFIEDLADWKYQQRFEKSWQERDERQLQSESVRNLERVKSEYEKRADEVRKTHPDYDEMVNSDELSISRAMAETIALVDTGPKVALYLAKNPDESDRIARMPPAQAAYELGRLESKMSIASAKKISTAPAPLSAIASTKAITADLANLSQEDYEKVRAKQGARWAR